MGREPERMTLKASEAIIGRRAAMRNRRTSSLQDLESWVTIPVAEATGYTITPLRGLGARRARRI